VSPDYFATLGIVLRVGRPFRETDTAAAPPVAIVNESFARRYVADRNPIGKRIQIGRFRGEVTDRSMEAAAVEIVAVAEDVRDASLRTEPRRTIYVPQAQASTRLSTLLGRMPVFLMRTRARRADLERAFVQTFRALDPALTTPEVLFMDELVARSLARERFGAALLGTLGALALALTALGIHGVLAYMVRQRRREIGVRIALGADPRQVTCLVLMQGTAPVCAGLAIGVVLSIGLSRLMASFLWGTTPADPATLISVAIVLLAVSLGVSWASARQAARLEPARTLNCQ
jgi:putative ABC transport system permease protein